MPYVTIRVTGDKVTEEQSNALISQTTTMIKNVLNKDPEITWVVIEDVPTDKWGIGGETYKTRSERST